MTTFVRTAYHQQKMLELEKEITRLRQRDNEKDAERYRYLRQIDRCWSWEGLLQLPDDSILRTEDIDAAIDAAMADPDDDFTRGEHDL